MNVKNMVSAKGNSIANQFIIFSSEMGTTTFQSYGSKIATFGEIRHNLSVYPRWDYSKTTLKYFKQFINENTVFKYESKEQFMKLVASDDRIKFIAE